MKKNGLTGEIPVITKKQTKAAPITGAFPFNLAERTVEPLFRSKHDSKQVQRTQDPLSTKMQLISDDLLENSVFSVL
ncbi:hypothetical protein [Paenibacillus baekrokdamisoli]|uniref:hypothetical protein n=1 Tax=Paenibacillus baekrokdamisoli TaxID=1712516 RepID=UPI001C847364|nr:hypothetical protein [Paenibacillus baekrokdamisoli]